MREVVIIGGGVAGLAAAHTLETLGAAYTLIEVKHRLGGSAATIHRDHFVFDSGPMHYPITYPDILETFGLTAQDILHPCDGQVAFTGGAETLVRALASRITAPVVYRMAVSTLGWWDNAFSICLENGMVWRARALILAAPARHAERMLYTLAPEAAYPLLDYAGEPLARLSFGYVNRPELSAPPDADFQRLAHPARTHANGEILQVAVQVESCAFDEARLVHETRDRLGWPAPAVYHVGCWPDTDPMRHSPEDYTRTCHMIEAMLPDRLAFIGLPYSARPRLDERLQQGVSAAHRIAAAL